MVGQTEWRMLCREHLKGICFQGQQHEQAKLSLPLVIAPWRFYSILYWVVLVGAIDGALNSVPKRTGGDQCDNFDDKGVWLSINRYEIYNRKTNSAVCGIFVACRHQNWFHWLVSYFVRSFGLLTTWEHISPKVVSNPTTSCRLLHPQLGWDERIRFISNRSTSSLEQLNRQTRSLRERYNHCRKSGYLSVVYTQLNVWLKETTATTRDMVHIVMMTTRSDMEK